MLLWILTNSETMDSHGDRDRSSERVGMVLVVVSAVGFGTLAVLGELAFAAGLNVPSVLALRFALATLLVWAVLVARRRRAGASERLRLRGRLLFVAVALGLVGYTGQSALFFWGLEYLTAGVTTLVLYTYPAFVLVLSALFLGEPLTQRRLVALPLVLGGVALVAGVDPVGVSSVGIAIVLGSAVVYSGYIVVSRVALADTDGLVLAGHVLPAAAVSFFAYGTTTGSLALPATPSGWFTVVGIAVLATVVPVVTFFGGIRRIGASRAGLVSTVEPIVAVVLGVLLLDEPLPPTTFVGGALVLVGVWLIHVESR
ncbi:DMT family transporter [Haloprofundus salilacus]|uniref:DMT family transporter n=1 Tax=Haloprofundus salilacus TaxID=2876190 RepID=UPI001CCF325F|nr:DMT family transporter [Haloprofundus salilacus]